jgi:hypothetical protein
VVNSNNLDTHLLKVKGNAAGTAPRIECPPPNAVHCLLHMWVPIVKGSEVPSGMIVDLNVAIVTLTYFTKVVRQKAAVMIVNLLSKSVSFQVRSSI